MQPEYRPTSLTRATLLDGPVRLDLGAHELSDERLEVYSRALGSLGQCGRLAPKCDDFAIIPSENQKILGQIDPGCAKNSMPHLIVPGFLLGWRHDQAQPAHRPLLQHHSGGRHWLTALAAFSRRRPEVFARPHRLRQHPASRHLGSPRSALGCRSHHGGHRSRTPCSGRGAITRP